MQMKQSILMLSLFAVTACGGELQLNLIINDPCNQPVLRVAGIEQIELNIASQEGETQQEAWDVADSQGEATDLTPVPNATVSVLGRSGSAAVAAISVGPVNLDGGDEDVIDLSLVFGKVDTFFHTTNADEASNGHLICTSTAMARQGHSATLLPDGKVWVVGGATEDTSSIIYHDSTEFFDPEKGVYAPGPTMEWTRAYHRATTLDDGRVLITGGDGMSGLNVTTWLVALVYDPHKEGADPFDEVGMRSQRANHTATLLDDGRVLLAGGTNGASVLATTEIFDPQTMSFCDGPSLLGQGRAHHAAVRIGRQQVALIGGEGSVGPLDSVQFVNVGGCGQGTATPGPNLVTARAHLSAAMVPGQAGIAVVGGFAGVASPHYNQAGLNSLELIKLNPTNLAQSTVESCSSSLAVPRGDATMLPVGSSLMIVGGVNTPNGVVNSSEVISFSGIGSCSPVIAFTAGGLGTPRAGAEATALVGGDILISGGYGLAGGIASIGQSEIYVRRR